MRRTQFRSPPYLRMPPATSSRVRTTSIGKQLHTDVTPAAAPAKASRALLTSCGPPGESATATPLYASNAAKFMALYGQTRRRFMALPRQNPRAPSAAITLRNAAPTGSIDRFSWYSSLIRSMGASSVRTTTVLSTPAARRSAVFRVSLRASSVGFASSAGAVPASVATSRACARDTLRMGNDLGDPERRTPRAVASGREAAPVSPVRSTPLAPAGSVDVTPTRPTGLRAPHRLRASPRAPRPGVPETSGPSEPGPLSSRPDDGRSVDRRPRPMWPHAPQPPAADGAPCVATIARALRHRVCRLASRRVTDNL